MPPRGPTCADGWAARPRAAINTIAQPPGGRGLRYRGRFLAGLLKRPRIFLSDDFHARCDAAARANLRRRLGR